jgi:hypothetical protein
MKKLLCMALLLAACGAQSSDGVVGIINTNLENTKDHIKDGLDSLSTFVEGWSAILSQKCEANLSELQRNDGLELFNGKPMNGLVCAKIVDEPTSDKTVVEMRGVLASVLSFKDGKQNGATIQFSKAGDLASIIPYEAGFKEGRAQLLLSWQADEAKYTVGEQTFELSFQGGVAVEGSCTLSKKTLSMGEILAFNNTNKAPNCGS